MVSWLFLNTSLPSGEKHAAFQFVVYQELELPDTPELEVLRGAWAWGTGWGIALINNTWQLPLRQICNT